MNLQLEGPSIGIDHRMSLASLDLLARIVAARAAAFGCLDALAVQDRCGRARLAPGTLAVAHDQMMVDRLPRAVVAQPGEPAIDRAPRGKAVRHEPPGDTTAQHVTDGVDDLAQGPRALAPAGGGGRQEGREDRPFRVGQVASIA